MIDDKNKNIVFFPDESDYFKATQPLSFFVKVQFRIPKFVLEESSADRTTDSFIMYDDYYGTNMEYSVDIEEDDITGFKTYWVDITAPKGKYYNNFITGFELTDDSGVKTFDITLADRSWGNIEKLITYAFQNQYEDTGEETYSGDEKSKDGKQTYPISEFFYTPGGIENIRLKFGYNHDTSIEDFDIYSSWGAFENRREDRIVQECPWTKAMIIEANRQIENNLVKYTIKALTSIDLIFEKIQMERKYANIVGDSYNLLNILNVPVEIWNNSKNNKMGTDYFIQKFYNSQYSVPLYPETILGNTATPYPEVYDKEYPSEELEKKIFAVNKEPDVKIDKPYNPWGAEAPMNRWIIRQGEKKKAVRATNTVSFGSPLERFGKTSLYLPPPKGTLGTILNDVLKEIPPKRFFRMVNKADSTQVDGSEPIPMTDEIEKILVENGGVIDEDLSEKYIDKLNKITRNKSQMVYEIDEGNTLNYKYRAEEGSDGRGKKIIFYYGKLPGTEQSTQNNFRLYRIKHPQSVATSFSISEDFTFKFLMSNILKPNPSSSLELIEGITGIKNIDEEKKKISESKDTPKEIKEKIESLNGRREIELAESKKNALDIVAKAEIKNDFSMGGVTIKRGDPNRLKTLSKNSVNKMEITILGDPFFFFDEKVIPGLYCIKIDFYRPNNGLLVDSNKDGQYQNKDMFLSGYYYVFTIKHSLSSGKYLTTLGLQRAPGDTTDRIDGFMSKIIKEKNNG